jgi:hypothetical protein
VGVAGFTRPKASREGTRGRLGWGASRYGDSAVSGRGDGFGGGATDAMFAVGIEVAAVIEVDSTGSQVWRGGRFGGARYDGRAVVRCRRMGRLARTRLCSGRSASS